MLKNIALRKTQNKKTEKSYSVDNTERTASNSAFLREWTDREESVRARNSRGGRGSEAPQKMRELGSDRREREQKQS